MSNIITINTLCTDVYKSQNNSTVQPVQPETNNIRSIFAIHAEHTNTVQNVEIDDEETRAMEERSRIYSLNRTQLVDEWMSRHPLKDPRYFSDEEKQSILSRYGINRGLSIWYSPSIGWNLLKCFYNKYTYVPSNKFFCEWYAIVLSICLIIVGMRAGINNVNERQELENAKKIELNTIKGESR